MKTVQEIEHDGIIQEIADKFISIGIVTKASCVSCEIGGSCSAGDVSGQTITIPNVYRNFSINEKVKIVLKESLGLRALFLGYVLPFLFVFFTMLIVNAITPNEAIVGLSSLAVLIPYYSVIYLLKAKLKKTFTYSLKKHYNF